MTTKTVWAASFSATNTTKKVVTQIARRLSQQTACPMEIYDFTHPQARKTPKAFAPGDLVVFGTPVYAGRVPNLLIRFVAAVQGNGALAVPVVCYGNRNYDDALMELYFEKGTLTQDDIRSGLKIGVSRRAVMPVFCGSRPAGRTAAISPLPRDLPTKSSAKWRPLPPWKAFPRLP